MKVIIQSPAVAVIHRASLAPGHADQNEPETAWTGLIHDWSWEEQLQHLRRSWRGGTLLLKPLKLQKCSLGGRGVWDPDTCWTTVTSQLSLSHRIESIYSCLLNTVVFCDLWKVTAVKLFLLVLNYITLIIIICKVHPSTPPSLSLFHISANISSFYFLHFYKALHYVFTFFQL